ncbi:MAG: DoxX family protein [Pseudonocardiaceae bacterium]
MDTVTVVLFVLTALVFLLSGTRNLRTRPDPPAPTDDQASWWHLSRPLLRMIGGLELLAVLGLLGGLVFQPLGIAAAAGLVLLMIGAIVYHIQAREPLLTLLFPAVPLLLSAAALVVGVAAL